jgi:diaminopimelate decarboxylase
MPLRYRHGTLHCEDVSLAEIAGAYGTPVYVYSVDAVRRSYRAIESGFAGLDHQICYALKANSNPAIVEELARLGAGADVVSAGELKLALRAGIAPDKIVFAGVGKTDPEIEMALESGILALNVESAQELEVINGIAGRLAKKAPVSLRVNPNIDIHGHPYITTGRSVDKFGISLEEIPALLERLPQMQGVELVGLHAHLGSQIDKVKPYVESARALAGLVEQARSLGLRPWFVDIGGGIGVRYELDGRLPSPDPEFAVDPKELGKEIAKVLKPLDCKVLVEPGRALVAQAGVLLTRVTYLKETRGKRFVIVDAGMNDLLRPGLYQAYHEIVPVCPRDGQRHSVDVVGPICESGDFFARERLLAPVKRGDLLAVLTAGAYGYVLSSNYNSRPRPAEVLVDGSSHRLIRPRENLLEDPSQKGGR